MWTTKTGPTCPRCGALVIPSGCVNRCKGKTMKTAREVAEGLRRLICLCSPRARTHSEACNEGVAALTAALESRDREWVEADENSMEDELLPDPNIPKEDSRG